MLYGKISLIGSSKSNFPKSTNFINATPTKVLEIEPIGWIVLSLYCFLFSMSENSKPSEYIILS